MYIINVIIMEDAKRENNIIKKPKSEVKNVVTGYFQKRNYSSQQACESTRIQQITHSLLERGVGRSNSIVYNCYSSDPIVIDHNFTKFVIWLKDQNENKNLCRDVAQIVGPLFCHLYVDILRRGHTEKAACFLKTHLSAVAKEKCDYVVKDLIDLFSTNGDSSKLIEKFRSKKIIVELNHESFTTLKEFVLGSCHVSFLQVLQTWFDFQGYNDVDNNETKYTEMASIEPSKDPKFQDLFNAINNLKKEPVPIFNVKIKNNKRTISSGILKRHCGLVAFAESNILRLMPLNTHKVDSFFPSKMKKQHLELINHTEQIYSIAISPDNNILVSASADYTICIYNLVIIALLHRCKGHLGPVYCVKVSSNSEYVVSGSTDTTVRLWGTRSGKTLRVFAGHTQSIICLEFHPNSLYVVSGSADKNIRLWDINKANPLRLLHAAKGTVYALAFNPSGRLIASASEDHKIRIWDLLTSKVTVELKWKESMIIHLVWNKNGEEICAGTVSGTIRVWNISTVKENSESNKHHEPVLTQAFNAKLLSVEYNLGTYSTLTM